MTASTAAADAAKASMEMFNSKNKERQYFEALKKHIDIQVAELRSMNNTIQKLEGTRRAAPSSYKQQQKYLPYTSRNDNAPQKSPVFDSKDPHKSLANSMNVKANGVSNFGSSVIPSSAPASMRSSVGQHPKSCMEILSMIQRGEIPPGIKEINDSPPNPDQPLPNPGMAQRIKPWDVAQPSNKSTYEKDLRSTSELKCDRVLPWWHKNNVRTETEPRNGMRTSMFDVPNDGWSIQSSVPSQPFCVTMPRAVS
ncbi:peroxisomal membrane protein PEX14-like isoform X2 [Pistacia vera]|nr:peroxisomal membrane protein PEX14-like isoform X2 [Pistacia vera]